MKQVKICNKSKKEIERTFAMYSKNEWGYNGILEIYDRAIIHIYPTKDTINDKNDKSTGYTDCLEFTVKTFDTKNRVYYETTHCDNIIIMELSPIVKVFKDQSTMLIFDGGIKILNGHGIVVKKLEN